MKRLVFVLAAFAMASGCGGGTSVPTPTGPSPNPTPSPVTAATWQGTVTAVRRTVFGDLDTTQTFQGTVTFEPGNINTTYDPPDLLAPIVPVDAVTYVLRPGLLQLVHTGSVGPCSYGTSTWDVLMKKSDGFLWVTRNGGVEGRVTLPDTLFPVTVTCPTGGRQGETSVQMDLVIKGSAAGTRIGGTMTPFTVAGTTFSGSWNFEAR